MRSPSPIVAATTLLLLCACRAPTGDSSSDSLAPDTDTRDTQDSGAPSEDPSGVIIVADSLENERLLVLRVPDGALLLELDLEALDPEHCEGSHEDHDTFCLPYEIEHRVGEDGQDRILAMYSPQVMVEEGVSNELDPGVLVSIVLSDEPELEWFVDQLDLSGVPLDPWDAICQENQLDPCNTDAISVPEKASCALRKPHAFSILEEDARGLRATVADTRNHRVLELSVTKGERCAQVTHLATATTHPDWSIYKNPNDVESWDEDGAVHTLVSFKGSEPDTAEQGAAGRGKLMYLRWEAGTLPAVQWVFPSWSEEEPRFLNGQHNLDIVQTDAGERFLLVAHSGGVSDTWHAAATPGEEHGSVLVASCCEESPRYLLDAHTEDLGVGYLRDVDLVSDGRLLLTDSGCLEPEGCPLAAQLTELRLPSLDSLDELQLPDRSGHWTADHAHQNLHVVEPAPHLLPAPYTDLGVGAYEADWVPTERLGETLRRLVEGS